MSIKVADEVWVATALLHNEKKDRESFRKNEIIDRVAKEDIYGEMRPGIMIHVSLHCRAQKRPNPGNYRMLTEDEEGNLRLFREGDDFHDWRKGGKMVPNYGEIPDEYEYLLDWWRKTYNKK
jgi:hypothetical protein